MRPAALAALGIAAYALILAATIPATVVASRVEADTGAAVRMPEARGTLWNGHARLLVAAANAPAISFDRVAWSWNPARLATASLGFDVTVESGTLRARFEIVPGPGRIWLGNLTAQSGAADLAGLHPLAATWRPGGKVSARASRLELDPPAIRGDLVLEWEAATVALSEVRPLGSYRAELDPKGTPGAFVVSTTSGPLRLAGRGNLAAGALRFSGEARGEGAQQVALEPLLALLGAKRPGGEYAIEWRAP